MATASLPNTLSEERLLALHKASLDLVSEISLENCIKKIALTALVQADAGYVAVGILNAENKIEKFFSVGPGHKEVTENALNAGNEDLPDPLMLLHKTTRVGNLPLGALPEGIPNLHPEMESFLGIPIYQDKQLIGQIYLTNKCGSTEFSEEDQKAMELLSNYAAVSIANARLYGDMAARDRALTRRNENLALLDQLASTLATSTDIDQILDKGLTQLMDYLRLEVGEIYLKLEDSKNLQLSVHRGEGIDPLWKKSLYAIGESTIGKTAKKDAPVVLTLAEYKHDDLNPNIRSQGIHQLAVLPMTGRRGIVGVLCVAACHPQPLDDLEVQFVQAISSWMATAIENVQLNLSGKRLAVLEERDRFAMDLHDGIIQSIYAVGLTLEHARLLMSEDPEASTSRIEQAIKDLNHSIRDIRAYILDLRPRQLHDESLMQGIYRLVQEFKANTLIEVNVQGPEGQIDGLQEAQAVALFHICQEALANIAKHGKAHHVEIAVWSTTDRTLIEVRDDGRGFDQDKVEINMGHGLSNMEVRAGNVGGAVDISSEPGNGTSVLAWVPLTGLNLPAEE